MKHLKTILVLFLTLTLISCNDTSDTKPDARGTGYATLVAYKISGKHKYSTAYLRLNKIGTIHTIELPNRTQPALTLGDSIKVGYNVYGNVILLNNINLQTTYYKSRGYFSLK